MSEDLKPEDVEIFSDPWVDLGRTVVGYAGVMAAERIIDSSPSADFSSRFLETLSEVIHDLCKQAASNDCNALVSATFTIDPFHGPDNRTRIQCVASAARAVEIDNHTTLVVVPVVGVNR